MSELKLRKAAVLKQERDREERNNKQDKYKEDMQKAVVAIEESHKKNRTMATTTGLCDEVLKELKKAGYRASRVKPDEFVGPGYMGEVQIEWD